MLGKAGSRCVIYRSDEIHLRHRANFRVLDPLDFLAEVSAHIPDPHEKTTTCYGWYSNRTRGARQQHGQCTEGHSAAAVAETASRAPLEVRRSWARPIRQVYQVDPLLCPRCGGTIRVIAVIEQAAVIRQILEHLDIAVPAHANPRPPVQRPPCLGGALRNERGVAEAPEWTDDFRDADLPLVDPLTI